MKGACSCTNTLNVHRYFMDRSEELVEVIELLPIVLCKAIVYKDSGIWMVLVERESIPKVDSTVYH